MNLKTLGTAILLAGMTAELTGCGSAHPYQAGMSQFSNAVFYNHKDAGNHWTVYVSDGSVTTGRWWYRRQHPVVYAQIGNTSKGTDSHIVIHFGGHTYGPTTLGSGAFMEFYIHADQIPRHVNIAWTQRGIQYHVVIPADSLIDVSNSMS